MWGSNFWLSHRKEKSPLTHGLNYRSACDHSSCEYDISIFSTVSHCLLLVRVNLCLESINEVLKLKFRKLQKTIVSIVKPPSIMDFLFQEAVIGDDDMMALLKSRDDPEQQCREMLAILHTSDHPQAFVQLYAAIKEERHLEWLIERVDNYTDKSVTDLIKKINLSKTKGKCRFSKKKRSCRVVRILTKRCKVVEALCLNAD